MLLGVNNDISRRSWARNDEAIFAKERERVDVYNDNFGYWSYGGTSVSTSTEGTLFIDLIDKNELVWQGVDKGDLVMTTVEKKETRIKEIVSKIMTQYPPGVEVK